MACRRYTRGGRLFKGKLSALSGLIGRPFVAFKHTVDVAKTVIMERVFYHIIDGVPVQPYRPSLEGVLDSLGQTLLLFRSSCPFIAAWTYEDFINSVHGRKRTLYSRAVARLEQGWTWGDVSRWTKFRAFIKHEKLPVVEGKRLVPRLIQPRSPEYNVLVGRYIKAAEKPIFHVLQEISNSSEPVVGKGMDVVELARVVKAKWDKYVDPICIGFDQSRFDQHISEAMLKYEHMFYTSVFHSRELVRLLSYQLESIGTVACNDGHCKYHQIGGRGSGDMNTGLGNTIIQFSILHSYCCSRMIEHEVSYMVNGDDSLIITERRNLPAFEGLPAFCESLGFVIKVEPAVDVFERISFCQMQPVFNGEQYVFCRAFPTAVNKDVVTTFGVTEANFRGYYAAVGECGLALSSGLPIFQAFYMLLTSFGKPLDLSTELGGMYHWRGRLAARVVPVSEKARYSFYLAFGVLPEHQEAIEASYQQLPPPVWGGIAETQYFPNIDLGCRQGV